MRPSMTQNRDEKYIWPGVFAPDMPGNGRTQNTPCGGRCWLHFDPFLFSFWMICLRFGEASVQYPIPQLFYLDFRPCFKPFSDDLFIDFQSHFTTSMQYVQDPTHAETPRLRSVFNLFVCSLPQVFVRVLCNF